MAELPTETTTDILSRLPAKSLLRFRCVSKPWCALIDSPEFIKMHHKRSIETKSNLSLILGGMGPLYSLDFDGLTKSVEVKPVEIKIPKKSVHFDVVGCCNGLILLQSAREEIMLFNPSTRKYRVLPETPTEYPSCKVIGAGEKYGLGYDDVNDDYKVIRLVEFTNPSFKWVGSEAKVYSLKSNSWKKIENCPYKTPVKRVWGAHLNGALHTVVNKNRNPNSERVIVSFNIGTERFSKISIPKIKDGSYYDMFVDVFEGCLCIRAIYDDSRTDLWVMKEYGVKTSWFMLLSLAPPLVQPYLTVYPLVYSKNREEVLLNYDDQWLLWYDLKKKTVRRAPFLPFPDPHFVEVYVESLVSLDDTKKIEQKGEVKQEKPNRKNKKKRDDFLSKGFKLKL